MAKAHLENAIRHIRKLAACEAANERTDRQLLHDFSVQRDQTAFAALFRRHGDLVFGVCQHVLGHGQDAEDAFQATFLVLAQSASGIKKRDAVASWLHGVAYRTAMRAKRDLARRRFHERQAMAMAKTKPRWDLALQDLQGIVDEEIQLLPKKYRAPFVLCCLEAKSKVESAKELGWKVGTVSSRLARARKLLQQRLTRRGVMLSAVMGATELAQGGTKAAVPSSLAEATIKAGVLYAVNKTAAAGMISPEVVALAQGVTKTMFSSKLKIATALLLAVSAVSTGLGGFMVFAANQAATKQAETQRQRAREQDRAQVIPVKHGPADGGQRLEDQAFRKLKLDADDLAEVTGVNVYKFQVAMPKGQHFRVVLREVREGGAEPRVLHQFPFVKDSDTPTTVRVGFLRSDRKRAGFLLSEEKEAEYRVDCPGCSPPGFATIVSQPLADVPPTRKTLIVSGSDKEAKQMGLKGLQLITVVTSEPGKPAPRATVSPRFELVIEP